MNILALDLGSTTGWALLTGDAVHSGSVAFKNGRFEGGGMRFLRFRKWLLDVKQSTAGDIDAVYFEEVRRHQGVDAAHIYGGLLAILTSWCEHHKIPYSGVGVGAIKKHVTGKGNASKDEMIAWAKSKGFAPADDNEADALAILDWGRRQVAEATMGQAMQAAVDVAADVNRAWDERKGTPCTQDGFGVLAG